VILGGKTGTGKTWLLKELSHSLDLEGLAHHRGSSFGRFPDGQPRQINFENNLAVLLMRLRAGGAEKFWLEDEGRMIGSICLPQSLRDKMTEAPLVMLEEELDYRINVILKDYVIDLYAYYEQYTSMHEKQTGVDPDSSRMSQEIAFEQFSEYLLDSLKRVKKRLGGDRYQHINKLMTEALKEQSDNGSIAAHKLWIETLLTSYYDPMYEYQLEKKQHRVIFRGNSHQILSNQTRILDMC
jgi:tRNA 2-selenouridine synthase